MSSLTKKCIMLRKYWSLCRMHTKISRKRLQSAKSRNWWGFWNPRRSLFILKRTGIAWALKSFRLWLKWPKNLSKKKGPTSRENLSYKLILGRKAELNNHKYSIWQRLSLIKRKENKILCRMLIMLQNDSFWRKKSNNRSNKSSRNWKYRQSKTIKSLMNQLKDKFANIK